MGLITIHNKEKPPFDEAALSKREIKKVDFEFAFTFQDGLIYEIRTAGITKTRREMKYLQQNN